MAQRRSCRYCGALFRVNPRVGDRHTTCSKKSCQKKRHDEAHAKWRKKNPNAYKERYSIVRTWLDQHPGFLVEYRADHPDYVKADNKKRGNRRKQEKKRFADIQDEMFRRGIEDIRGMRGADIQDPIARRGLL